MGGDSEMTPEQLEAHRVRFEQQSGEPETMKGQRRGDGYANHSDTRTWQAYQCGIADADRAQRAAPGVKPRLIGWRTSDFLMETADKAKAENWQVHHEIQPIFEGDPHTSLKPPEVQAAPYAQLSDQSVVMVVAFDEGVKEPRIVSWNKFTVGKHRLYAAQPPQQSAQPVAWMHETPGRVDVIHDEVKKLLSAAATDYLHRPIDKSEKYTIPLYAAAQPVEAANGWEKGLDIRMSQGWKLKGGICPVLYSDTVNGYGVGRDDLWLATTDALKSAQPVEVQRVPLTDATQFEKDVARWMEKDGLTREQAECEVNYRTTRKALKSGLSAHGIKPTSSEGGA